MRDDKPWITCMEFFKLYYKQPMLFITNYRRNTMWTKPAATEMRFGFEVTMYVMNK